MTSQTITDPTWDLPVTDPVEQRVQLLLQTPCDQVMKEIETLCADITEATPRHIIGHALPAYLATGRPLAMLDERFTPMQPVDRLKSLAETSASFRHHVLRGLRIGLATAKLRRAEAMTSRSSNVSRGLLVLIEVVQDELNYFTKLDDAEQKRIADAKKARRPRPASTSWVDRIIAQEYGSRLEEKTPQLRDITVQVDKATKQAASSPPILPTTTPAFEGVEHQPQVPVPISSTREPTRLAPPQTAPSKMVVNPVKMEEQGAANVLPQTISTLTSPSEVTQSQVPTPAPQDPLANHNRLIGQPIEPTNGHRASMLPAQGAKSKQATWKL
jgi:hypothetical protein